MKKAQLIAFVLLIIGCGEIPPFIDYSEPILLARDTTYVTNDFQRQVKKNVLIEDISGVRCKNCPSAAEIAHNIQVKNEKGRVVVLTLHSKQYTGNTAPFDDSADTFNTQEATDIVISFLGEPIGLPSGAIDRKLFDGNQKKTIEAYRTWETFVNKQMALNAKAELDLTVIQESGRSVIANIKTTFVEDDPNPVYLSVFIVESHITSRQTMPNSPTNNYQYEHNAILREGVTSWSGLKLAESVKAGRVFEKGLRFDIPPKYVIDNCSIVVLINKNDKQSTEVIQCIEKPIE